MTRTGKIARLPREVRDQLNRRLCDGEPGSQLDIWLNALPESQAVLAREFAGRPISEQNLSEWKRGGYGDWLAKKERAEERREQIDWALKATGGNAADAAVVLIQKRLKEHSF